MPICCGFVQKEDPKLGKLLCMRLDTKYDDARTRTLRKNRKATANGQPLERVVSRRRPRSNKVRFSVGMNAARNNSLTSGRHNPCQTRNAPRIAPAALGEHLVLNGSKSN